MNLVGATSCSLSAVAAVTCVSLGLVASPARAVDVWTQIGGDIQGILAQEESGFSVALSADGSVLAIGAFYGGTGNRGQVRIYEWNGVAWSQRGSSINGEAADDKAASVDLSDDGSILAIGSPDNDGAGSSAGHARVFEWNGSAWVQRGLDLDGEAGGDNAGWSVSLSGDGNTIAVGAYKNDGNGSDAGSVRVYTYSGGSWSQRGTDIDGEGAGDYFGRAVSLSGDGSILAVGARLNDGAAVNAGHVRAFSWTGAAWTQLGSDLDGPNADAYFGNSVSLSTDGTWLAVGIPFDDTGASDAGAVAVFAYSGGSWSQVGSRLNGNAASGRAGWSVSLSGSGDTVAFGVPLASSNSGVTRAFSWIGGAWTQVGGDIAAEDPADQDGSSLDLSRDASTLAIGAPRNDDGVANAGQVRAFSFSGVPGGSGSSPDSGRSTGSSSGDRYVDFTFVLPDGRECTAISPVRVRVGVMYVLPGVDATCQTLPGATVAGWTIPVPPGFGGYGSSNEPFPPGLAVRVVDSQQFTVVAKEPVLRVDFDANIAVKDACVQTRTLHTSNGGRVEHVWIPRDDIEMARFPTSSSCVPQGHKLGGWNTAGDGSGLTYPPGAPAPQSWAEHPTNERHLFAVWLPTSP